MSLEKGKCYSLKDQKTGIVRYCGRFVEEYNIEDYRYRPRYIKTFINTLGDDIGYSQDESAGKEFVEVTCRPPEEGTRLRDLVETRCYTLHDEYLGHYLGKELTEVDAYRGEKALRYIVKFDNSNLEFNILDEQRIFVEVTCQTNSSSSSSAVKGGSAVGGGSAPLSRISTLEQQLAQLQEELRKETSKLGKLNGGSVAAGGTPQSRILLLEEDIAYVERKLREEKEDLAELAELRKLKGGSAAGAGSAPQSRISSLEQQIAQLQEELLKEKEKNKPASGAATGGGVATATNSAANHTASSAGVAVATSGMSNDSLPVGTIVAPAAQQAAPAAQQAAPATQQAARSLFGCPTRGGGCTISRKTRRKRNRRNRKSRHRRRM
jgi:hypothetical protein